MDSNQKKLIDNFSIIRNSKKYKYSIRNKLKTHPDKLKDHLNKLGIRKLIELTYLFCVPAMLSKFIY
jgi:hypothetical protein